MFIPVDPENPNIPDKSSPHIQQSVAKLTELAASFDAVAAKKQSSWWSRQKHAAGVYRNLADDARALGDKLDKQDVSQSMNDVMVLHTVFLGIALSNGSPKVPEQATENYGNPLGRKMTQVSDLLLKEFCALDGAKYEKKQQELQQQQQPPKP